jgi:hypothetical protein
MPVLWGLGPRSCRQKTPARGSGADTAEVLLLCARQFFNMRITPSTLSRDWPLNGEPLAASKLKTIIRIAVPICLFIRAPSPFGLA